MNLAAAAVVVAAASAASDTYCYENLGVYHVVAVVLSEQNQKHENGSKAVAASCHSASWVLYKVAHFHYHTAAAAAAAVAVARMETVDFASYAFPASPFQGQRTGLLD